jgi:hypothetical protein
MTEKQWVATGQTVLWGGMTLSLERCGTESRLLKADGELYLQYEYSADGQQIRYSFPFHETNFHPLSEEVTRRQAQ